MIDTSVKLFLFDVDGTLCPSYHSQELFPSVVKWFQTHKPQNVALVTNQGGVGMKHWFEIRGQTKKASKYPTISQAQYRLQKFVRQIKSITRGNVNLYVCYRYQASNGNWCPVPYFAEDKDSWSKEWRKPDAGMLIRACDDLHIEKEACIMVGDRVTDYQASKKALIPFAYAENFFEYNQ